MTILTGECKMILAPALVFLDDLSVFNFHYHSTCPDGGVELSSIKKSAKAWALIIVLDPVFTKLNGPL